MTHKDIHPFLIAVVGGGGHVGLPLSLLLAKKGFTVKIIDTDHQRIEALKQSKFPFLEQGGPELLQELLGSSLILTTEHREISDCHTIILTVGTPVDEHLNPNLSQVYTVVEQLKPYLRNDQTLILRSTLFPGTSQKIHSLLSSSGLDVGVSFCPERIAQGKALKELQELPQIISGSSPSALEIAKKIFLSFAPEVIELSMTEAELAKLFTNAWRYIKFSVANQFYTIATEKGFDFYRIYEAITHNVWRASDLPVAGFSAGPCLFKDTMQLAAYNRQSFALGHAAMLVNETLPDFLVDQVKKNTSLAGVRVGILGMAFKADNDDNRESLAYKLRKLLQHENAIVLCTDPYILDSCFYPLETVLNTCKFIFIGCPHSVYRNLNLEKHQVIDCWGLTRGKLVSDIAHEEIYR